MAKVATKATTKTTKTATASKRSAPTTTNVRPDGLREGSAGAKLVDFVCSRKEDNGATNKELCEYIGWVQCLPFLTKSCEQAGVELKRKKVDGQPTRYYGVRKTNKKSAPKVAAAEATVKRVRKTKATEESKPAA
jgi:hypothetical protein